MALKSGILKVFGGAKKALTKPFKIMKNGTKKEKKALFVKTIAGSLIGATLLGGCVAHQANKKDDYYVEPSTSISTVDGTDKGGKEELVTTTQPSTQTTTQPSTQTTTDENEFLSDELEDTEVIIEDNTVTEEQEENHVNNGEEIIEDVIYEDGIIIDESGDAVIDNTTSSDIVTPDNSYPQETPDNNIQDNNNDGNTTPDSDVSQDEAYMDENGIIWGSYQQYLDFMNDNVTDDLYTAPDGSLWDSEELYLQYLEDYNNAYAEQEQVPEQSVTENETGMGDSSGYYYDAENDIYYDSYESYLELTQYELEQQMTR